MTNPDQPITDDTTTPTPDSPTKAKGKAGPAPERTTLKDLLENQVPPDEAFHVIEDWEEGILEGSVPAITLDDDEFEFTYTSLSNRPKKRTLKNEVVLLTQEFLEWLESKQAQTRRTIKARTGKITVKAIDSESDDNLQELIRLRQEHVQKRTKTKPKRNR